MAPADPGHQVVLWLPETGAQVHNYDSINDIKWFKSKDKQIF